MLRGLLKALVGIRRAVAWLGRSPSISDALSLWPRAEGSGAVSDLRYDKTAGEWFEIGRVRPRASSARGLCPNPQPPSWSLEPKALKGVALAPPGPWDYVLAPPVRTSGLETQITKKRKLLLELTLAARYLRDKNAYHEEARKKYADWGRSIQSEDSLLF